MNAGQRQVIAEKVASTVRVLELLGYDYAVTAPKNPKKKGNASPRVVCVNIGKKGPLRIYNGKGGSTWANEPDGTPIPGIVYMEDLCQYLKDLRSEKDKKRVRRR